MLIYLFYVLTNLFFFPNYNSATAAMLPAHGIRRQTIQVHHNAPGFIDIGEKSVIDDDLLNFIKSVPIFFLLTFFGYRFLRIEKRPILTLRAILTDLQHSYLSFCILRI
jgi:hypothetical protein